MFGRAEDEEPAMIAAPASVAPEASRLTGAIAQGKHSILDREGFL